MGQISVVQVRGETVKVDMDRMMQLIAHGVDANTAILESIVEAVPGGQVCQLVGQNQFQQIYEDTGGNYEKSVEIYQRRNPKGFECYPPPGPQQVAPPPKESPGNLPIQQHHIDHIHRIIGKLDPSKSNAFDDALRQNPNMTLNEAMQLAQSLVGVERFNAELERL
jgi:hypothetical protein